MEKLAGVAIFLVGLLILFSGASSNRDGGMVVYGVRTALPGPGRRPVMAMFAVSVFSSRR